MSNPRGDRLFASRSARPAEAPDTRTAVLDAALERFEAAGLFRTTVDDVARAAGVSRVTVYRHFGDRDALVEAVLLREEERFFQELEEAIADAGGIEEKLAEGFACALLQIRSHVALQRLLETDPELILPHLTVRAEPVLVAARSFVARLLETAREAGELPALDVEVAAELLCRQVLSLLLTPASAVPLETADDARRFARRYLFPALASRHGADAAGAGGAPSPPASSA